MNKPLIEISGGVERHYNGSFTMFGSIEGDMFKETYYDYTLAEARKLFKMSICVYLVLTNIIMRINVMIF
jgi:hypothetical protein